MTANQTNNHKPLTMIQPHEIRPGNVLMYNCGSEDKPDWQLTIVDWADIKWVSENPDDYNRMHRPAILSPDVLNFVGFSDKEYKDGYIGIDIRSGGITTDFVLTKPKVIGEFQDCYCWQYLSGNVPFFKELPHLHHFQNLFFDLTGQELDVTKIVKP